MLNLKSSFIKIQVNIDLVLILHLIRFKCVFLNIQLFEQLTKIQNNYDVNQNYTVKISVNLHMQLFKLFFKEGPIVCGMELQTA